MTLFRAHHNVVDPAQIRRLTAAIQGARPAGAPPLLVAADQEGGQLVGLGDGTTQFAGAMALGATGDEALAERVAGATARELRALGVNVDYAPVCDVANNPANPALGIRSFGDDPEAVGRLAAATVRGLQDDGVAATVKHFPGAGDTAADPHHELPLVPRTNAELAERELVPFRAALDAGARMVMTGHFALPGQTDDLPTSLSAAVLRDLLRGQLQFDGVTVSDALDMRALAQGSAQIVDAIAALRAGEDVLLGTRGRTGAATAGGRPRAGAAARPDRCRRRRCRDAPAGRAAPLAGRLRPAAARRRRVRRASGTRRRAGPTFDHPRPQRRPAVAVEAGRRRADRGRPVDARRPDAGRHVVDGAADAGIGAPPPARGRRGDPPAGGAGRGRHRGSRRAARSLRPRRRRDVLRAPPAGAGGAGRRRSWRPASRPSPSPCARRGTCSPTRRPEPMSAATASCRRRWRRWRPRCWARRRSSAGCPSTSPVCIRAVTGSSADRRAGFDPSTAPIDGREPTLGR